MFEKVDKKSLINKLGYTLLVLTIILVLIYVVQFVYAYTKSTTRSRKVSPELTLFLKEYGDYIVENIDLCQQPVSKLVRNAFYYTTAGAIKKEFEELQKEGKDFYHPYLLLTLRKPASKEDKQKNPQAKFAENSKPVFAIFDKVQLVRIILLKDANKATPVSDPTAQCIFSIQGNKDLTLTVKELIESSKEQMKDAFNTYHCKDNNCGIFLQKTLLGADERIYEERSPFKSQVDDFLQAQFDIQTDVLSKYPKSQAMVNGMVEILSFLEYWKTGQGL
jgi:hypothetical protein